MAWSNQIRSNRTLKIQKSKSWSSNCLFVSLYIRKNHFYSFFFFSQGSQLSLLTYPSYCFFLWLSWRNCIFAAWNQPSLFLLTAPVKKSALTLQERKWISWMHHWYSSARCSPMRTAWGSLIDPPQSTGSRDGEQQQNFYTKLIPMIRPMLCGGGLLSF